jgi:lipopolysaccharide biosynthesis glycosyltransferase
VISIVTASDDGYVHHLAGMLHSASLYHPEARYFLLDNAISADNADKLRGLAAATGIDLTFIPCASLLRDRLNTRLTTYARLMIPLVLGEDIGRCLYIDADTSITGSLDDLFYSDMGDCPVAATKDIANADLVKKESSLHSIELGRDYFNAGMMLIDLRRWRGEKIADKAIEYANRHPERMLFWDQSALNKVLYLRNRPIDPIWNFFHWSDARTLSEPPRIVHYTTLPKPPQWPESPFAELYKFHRDQTPWPFAKRPPPGKNWFKEKRALIAAALGIEKYRKRREHEELLEYIRREVAEPALTRARALSTASARKSRAGADLSAIS